MFYLYSIVSSTYVGYVILYLRYLIGKYLRVTLKCRSAKQVNFLKSSIKELATGNGLQLGTSRVISECSCYRTGSVVVEAAGMVEMVKVKAYRGLEIHRFEIDPSSSLVALKGKIITLFRLHAIFTFVINYHDKVGNCITIISDEELKKVLSNLDGGETLHLQIEEVQPKGRGEFPREIPLLTYDLPDLYHDFSVSTADQRYEKIKSDLQKKAELAQYHAMCQANEDVKCAPAGCGEVAEKKSKAVCRGFGSWQPKEEKGNYDVITYGPVGYEIHYTYNEQEGTKPEGTKTGDDHQEKKSAKGNPETKSKKQELDDKPPPPETKQKEEPTKTE